MLKNIFNFLEIFGKFGNIFEKLGNIFEKFGNIFEKFGDIYAWFTLLLGVVTDGRTHRFIYIDDTVTCMMLVDPMDDAC